MTPQFHGFRRSSLIALAAMPMALIIFTACETLPGTTAPPGDRPPLVRLTQPTENLTVDQGAIVLISYQGEDGETQSRIKIYVDRDNVPASGNETVLRDDIVVGPGVGTGQIQWNTTDFEPTTYFIFAEIDDGVNDPVLATGLGQVQLVPTGSSTLTNPPRFEFIEPVANLGLSSNDTVTVRYRYGDRDTPVKVTLMLDKDRNPSNDDFTNPGDPLDPNSKLIILTSAPRLETDAVLPPDVPGQAPQNIDSIEIRTNPRDLPSIPNGGFSTDKLYLFDIDFSRIPIRENGQPYFLRATIDDGDNPPVHSYAVGSLTITRLASGFVDLRNVGQTISGVRFQGFSSSERLGTLIQAAGDTDFDTVDDFFIGARFASPINRANCGAAYLIRGRRKLQFPPDSDGNGLPDTLDSSLNVIDFPVPPPWINVAPDPQTNVYAIYAPEGTGRFGGVLSINSIGSFFRGVLYGMPEPQAATLPPESLRDPLVANLPTAGLTSIAVGDFGGNGIADFIFGLPFISSAQEYHDDDPSDGGGVYGDGFPNSDRCNQNPGNNDDITPARSGSDVETGLVIITAGTVDVEDDASGDGFVFSRFVDAGLSGQFDPAGVFNDEGILLGGAQIPLGVRIRGAWWGVDAPSISAPIDSTNEYGSHVAVMPSVDNDGDDELLISVPGHDGGKGRVDLWYGDNFITGPYHGQPVLSLPSYITLDTCVRGFVVPPSIVSVFGAAAGDRLGNGRYAGQINQDGTPDIICGAPFADRDVNGNGQVEIAERDVGVAYILFTPAGGWGNTDLATENVPRVEIWGRNRGDGFGDVHGSVGDINGDGLDDVAIASPNFDDAVFGNQDAGFVGVIFGNRPLTGENVFFADQIGTDSLSGVRFLGATIGAAAGTSVRSAGDFNKDGYGDIIITSPGEVRQVDGQNRLGVVYLVFGGPHLINKAYNLSSVGNPDLPGIVFVSSFIVGTEDEAAVSNAAGIGDIDGDGFDDIAIAAPLADFVNPASPNQRRNDAGEVYVVYGSNFGSNKIP